MSPFRLAIAALTAIAVLVLLGWQIRREQIVKACLDSGGAWHGHLSTCGQPMRPMLRRGLERS